MSKCIKCGYDESDDWEYLDGNGNWRIVRQKKIRGVWCDVE